MTGSGNSWNIEELVTHMETMQADIDSLESKASELLSQNQQLMPRVQELIVENTRLSQNLSQKETQVQKLSSEISKLQSLLQEMKNELLEKSVLIKKLRNTALILKQNRNLREYIRKLTQEKLELQRTVDSKRYIMSTACTRPKGLSGIHPANPFRNRKGAPLPAHR